MFKTDLAEMTMKIVIPGGTGQVGTVLARAFHRDGHEVVVLSRYPRRYPKTAPWRVVRWDPADQKGWPAEIDGADVVINLAGRSVNCRYTKKNKEEILRSRVSSVHAVGRAIREAKRPPAVWLQMSTATIYAHRYDAPNDEISGRIGGSEPDAPAAWRFSIDVATAWERALDEIPTPRTRKVKLRSAVVMNPDPGSVFSILLTLVRLGLGGTAGNGRQYVSWIHEIDFVRAVYWLIDREHLDGAINLAAPNPLPNRDFMAELRQAWGIPVGLPARKWMLEIAAFFHRTETELLLKSRRVVPRRLLEDGFAFQYPKWAGAAEALCRRRKMERAMRRNPQPWTRRDDDAISKNSWGHTAEAARQFPGRAVRDSKATAGAVSAEAPGRARDRGHLSHPAGKPSTETRSADPRPLQ
jgi:uncharacterized protein (TIGR01777 family)